MQFLTSMLAASAALATIASAASVHFVNQDNTTRTLMFTPSLVFSTGNETISNLTIKGLAAVNQTFPTGYIGNWYSRSDGANNTSGMLGEVCFDSWRGMTYFDVSAIVNPDDNNGVKEMFPLGTNTPLSGCQSFPCDNAYNAPDDIQTQATDSNQLVCLIGNLASSKRSIGGKFHKDAVAGKRSSSN
ncbi:hypothetical protein SBOR_8243 [Sclerotinia borealis F-4128]|uniref:DNase1 protein n=1 Tax=Sclerotinia borealis (strain F-4128) TaxID=1432307 RepID=W9C3P8_SCLBF|nr:hypothetical protein SBOR_8243 [Sclerotinia borealis F-4128]